MHVAPRWGPRWYNFTILLSPDQISREETIQKRYFCLANPILWVSHSHSHSTGWYSWQGSRSILGLAHVVTGPGVMVSSLSWLWSGFNQPGDRAHDTLSAPVKWKFNKTSEQKKNPPFYYVPFQWSDTFLDVFTLWKSPEEASRALNVSQWSIMISIERVWKLCWNMRAMHGDSCGKCQRLGWKIRNKVRRRNVIKSSKSLQGGRHLYI